MKTKIVSLAFVLTLLGLGGCSGGTILGLFPAPKFLKGNIENGTYFAKDHSFSVLVPHKEDKDYFRYMEIKEKYLEGSTEISFGPSGADTAIYRIYVSTRDELQLMGSDFKFIAGVLVHINRALLQQKYGSEPKVQLNSEHEIVNGRPALYWRFEQVLPSEVLTYEVYAIDFNSKIVITWAQLPRNRSAGSAMSPKAFAESVRLGS